MKAHHRGGAAPRHGRKAAAFAVILATLAGGCADAQVTGSIFDPPAAQPEAAPARAVHPLMTPQAIAAAEANFNACIAGLYPLAQAKGISQRSYQQLTAGLTPT